MADGASFNLDSAPSQDELIFKKTMNKSRGETEKSGITLYKSNKFDVFVPKKPNIPLNEGLHIEVSSDHDSTDSPKEVLARYALALGSAKVLAESGMTQDAWANTRVEQGQMVSVYGRVPGVEKSWRAPVDTFNRDVPEIENLEPNYNTQKLQELSSRYLPKWEQLVRSIDLFKKGINEKNIEGSNSYIVWENDRFIVDVVKDRHIKGYHLVVNPKESFRRQWQTNKDSESQSYIESTLEATAVAMGIQKLLAEGKGEIHNSGNWAPCLKSVDDGGRFDLQNFQKNIKTEKKSHRPDVAASEEQFDTSMHAHVYIPSEGPVILPPMSKQEAIERGRVDIIRQWEEIPPTTPVEVEEIKAKLREGKLAKWLEENCKGKLISKTI